MHPNFINLFGIQLTTHGLFMAMAFATLWYCAVSRGRKLHYSQDFLLNLITIIVISAFISARLLHVLVSWDYYAQHPSSILFSRDGYVFLGGFVGASLCSAWYTLRKKQSILGVADLFAPYLALAQGIGRIGCFMFGCCFGKVCSLPWAVRFPLDSPAYIHQYNLGLLSSDALRSLPVHPSQLYESVFSFLHFGVLLLIRSKQSFKGQLAMCYLMIYSGGRFLIEYTRGDDVRGIWAFFSTSQWLSLFLFGCGLLGYLAIRKKGISPERITPAVDAPQE